MIAALIATLALAIPSHAEPRDCEEFFGDREIEPMSLLTEREQELLFEEFADFEPSYAQSAKTYLRRGFARALDRARLRPLFTLGDKGEPDAVGRELYKESERLKAECGVIEALDRGGRTLFTTPIVTSHKFAEVELGPAMYALLAHVRQAPEGKNVSLIRVRHTHPVVPNHRTSRFGWDDWLAAARFRVHADLVLDRPIHLESEIVYRRAGGLEAKRFAIAAERSVLNGDYFDWSSFEMAQAAKAGPRYREMMRRYFDFKKSDVEIRPISFPAPGPPALRRKSESKQSL